ncbi:hypothetical protein BGZ82_001889, partial [Podila clonocystis]
SSSSTISSTTTATSISSRESTISTSVSVSVSTMPSKAAPAPMDIFSGYDDDSVVVVDVSLGLFGTPPLWVKCT